LRRRGPRGHRARPQLLQGLHAQLAVHRGPEGWPDRVHDAAARHRGPRSADDREAADRRVRQGLLSTELAARGARLTTFVVVPARDFAPEACASTALDLLPP